MLLSYAVMVVYPMFWMTYTSLKPNAEVFLKPFALPVHFSFSEAKNARSEGHLRKYLHQSLIEPLRWDNFSRAWVDGRFGQYFFNSVLITSTTVVVTVFLAALSAYALARFVFPGSRSIYFYFLAGLMIPLQLAIVPLFFELKSMDLLDSLFGLFLVYVGFGFPFSIFVLTGFFRSLPSSLHESALLDGASEFAAFWHVMLPLARPGLVTVGIFLFLGNWNEFFVAFICLSGKGSEHLRTLPLGLANITIVAQYRTDWGVAFAGVVLMMLPMLIVYIFFQKQLTKGITAGAVKG
jgi:ABC-type glycerol-3-phosphate transport system permease component